MSLVGVGRSSTRTVTKRAPELGEEEGVTEQGVPVGLPAPAPRHTFPLLHSPDSRALVTKTSQGLWFCFCPHEVTFESCLPPLA